MDSGLKNKVAIVTGGAIDLGRAISRALAVEDAANVVVFLVSDKTNMMTDQGVNLTGGIEMH